MAPRLYLLGKNPDPSKYRQSRELVAVRYLRSSRPPDRDCDEFRPWVAVTSRLSGP